MPEATRSLPVRVDVRLTESEREFLTQEAIKRDMRPPGPDAQAAVV